MRRLITIVSLALLAACAAAGGERATAAAPWCPNGMRYLPPFCAKCHGDFGRGDGPLAAALEPKPRNFSDGAWQRGVTDERIAQVILAGGAAVGISPAMPAHPAFADRPAVVERLVRAVRACGNPSL